MSDKITLIIGASTNSERYANKAIQMLRKHGHQVVAVGRDNGMVADVMIENKVPEGLKPDTVSLYINPQLQEGYTETILALHPRRVIFNPGTENETLEALLEKNGIEATEACTLVLLSTGQY